MAAPPLPRIDGREAKVTHRDGGDLPWIPVRRQRNADASVAEVREKWVAFSVTPLYLALFAQWDPGMIVRRHGHYSPHTITVLAGSFTCAGAERD